MDVRYLAADAPHVHAGTELSPPPATGATLAARRCRTPSAGDQRLDSRYAPHMGAFFGTLDIVMKLAGFTLAAFFVTGALLYLRRRRMTGQAVSTPTIVADAAAGPHTLLVT